ncbi:hypothetical protein ACH4F6_37890 [Streptomyces sp. NPDC017936]|uniref:hypothetical protein n=1 Tax=Streptomyces sp. NPDC017936 TaxID=3365016 RepID=UPI0037B759B5
MDAFEIPGNVRGTALRLAPTGDDGKAVLTVWHRDSGAHSSVILDRSWLLPLGAWFAGEAQPVALGDRPGTLYGRHLAVFGDERATVWSTHTWARLDCVLPFGTARVRVGARGRAGGVALMLSSEARQDIAVHLRRLDAELTV